MQTTNMTNVAGNNPILKFKVKHGDKKWNEIGSYNEMLEWHERDVTKDDHFQIDAVINHRKAVMFSTTGDWEVLIRWPNGETSWNCLNVTYSDDPLSVSIYALKNGLLKTPRWKRCKTHTRKVKKFARLIHQTKPKCHRMRPVYKYGTQVTRNHIQALKGFQKIPSHMVYDMEHDGCHKSRFVAGAHRTSTPVDSIYSGVVSLQGIRLANFIAELNGIEPWSPYVENAHLESHSTEKTVSMAGPEFGALEGHTFCMVKALYGLRLILLSFCIPIWLTNARQRGVMRSSAIPAY